MNAPADGPVKLFGLAALRQRQVAQAEQVQRRIERLLRVVKTLQQVLRAERAIRLLQIDQRLLGIVRHRLERIVAESAYAQDVEHQHAVIGGDGAAAFGHDGRMRHFGFVADILDVIDDVVGVLLQRVVDARFEIGLRAVVVDAQAAADIQVLQSGARALQLHVNARGFDHRGFDLPDIGDLAAQMEVQQLRGNPPCPPAFI